MTEIVNLRRVRKRLAREKDALAAEQNRVRFGRTRQERLKCDLERNRLLREVDGAKLEQSVPVETVEKVAMAAGNDASVKSDVCGGSDT